MILQLTTIKAIKTIKNYMFTINNIKSNKNFNEFTIKQIKPKLF
jgi:hypothetical protein